MPTASDTEDASPQTYSTAALHEAAFLDTRGHKPVAIEEIEGSGIFRCVFPDSAKLRDDLRIWRSVACDELRAFGTALDGTHRTIRALRRSNAGGVR